MINEKLDVAVSFDTTGSMYPVLSQVRRDVETFVKSIFSEFTDLRLAIIAHGDYCDKDDPYTIRVKDFTRDEVGLCKFVRNTDRTYGGDADECYELVLNTAHKVLKWRDDARKIMIMIGDASPHGVHYPENTDKLDWKLECEELQRHDIKVFAVHALSYYRNSSKYFYNTVAEITGGTYLTLDQFNEIEDLIKITCYNQGGEERLNEYITIIKDNGRMTTSLNNNIKRLQGIFVDDSEKYRIGSFTRGSSRRTRKVSDEEVVIKDMEKLVPVMPGRFQTMMIDKDVDIKGFVTSQGIEFKKGRGFYELSKAETVQQYKEVIIQDRETGEMFNGSQVREELGLSPQTEKGGVKERIHKSAADKYRVFIQSTSVNRKLKANTMFLYEISDIEDIGTVIEEESIKKVTESVVEKETSKEVKVEEIKETIEEPVKTVESEENKEHSFVDSKMTIIGDEFEVEEPKTKKKTSKKAAKKKELTDEEKEKIKAEKEVEKEKAKEQKRLEKLEKDLAKCYEDINSQSDVVNIAIERYKVSKNKKNTTYLRNNINKLRDKLNKLESMLDS